MMDGGLKIENAIRRAIREEVNFGGFSDSLNDVESDLGLSSLEGCCIFELLALEITEWIKKRGNLQGVATGIENVLQRAVREKVDFDRFADAARHAASKADLSHNERDKIFGRLAQEINNWIEKEDKK